MIDLLDSNLEVVLGVAAFVISGAITRAMMIYAKGAKLLDVPNQRSSHLTPTPRGGGLGIVLAFLASIVWLFGLGRIPAGEFCALLFGGSLIAAIGLADDHKHIPVRWRLLAQVIAASFAVWVLDGVQLVQLGNQQVSLGLVGNCLVVVFVVWLINLYNFMDGIDGIAATQTLSIVVGVVILTVEESANDLPLLFLVFGAAVAGFLVWNWPPAKIFMGDVGSGFLGFVLAVLAISSSNLQLLSIWVWLILSGVFIVDATMTLVVRIVRREKWYSPHNTHAYQKAARRLQGHRPVTIAVFLINMLWLLPIAWLATEMPEGAWWLACLSLAPLAVIGYFLGAGRPDISSEK